MSDNSFPKRGEEEQKRNRPSVSKRSFPEEVRGRTGIGGKAMIRLFEQHRIRKVRELDGMWDFTMEGFPKGIGCPYPAAGSSIPISRPTEERAVTAEK